MTLEQKLQELEAREGETFEAYSARANGISRELASDALGRPATEEEVAVMNMHLIDENGLVAPIIEVEHLIGRILEYANRAKAVA